MSMTLLFDVSNLAYRALYTTGGLSFEGLPTGVLFGILRDIDNLTDQFAANRCVFAFDSGGAGYRGQIDSQYKANRRDKELTEEEVQNLIAFRQQVRRLGTELLPKMGFKNIFRVKGYEADDIIAYVAERLKDDEEAIIVSTDNDLLQCIRPNVSCYSPTKKTLMTWSKFRKEYGILPTSWADVKAIAGCSSDNVVGIKGVGEKTAVKFLKGQLKPSTKTYIGILDGMGTVARNRTLVTLPLRWEPPLELPSLVYDEHTPMKRMEVLKKLGIRSRRIET